MSIQCSVYIATSLDGYISREDGNIDWLNEASANIPKGEDMGYYSFMDTVDALVMGRNTFEQVLTFGEWHYGNKPVIVLSSKELIIPKHLPDTVTHSSETPEALTQRLEQKGYKRLYIDGGVTIQRFLAAGVINDMVITLVPIVLGSGKPLFGNTEKDIMLEHVKTETFSCGFVQLTYNVKS